MRTKNLPIERFQHLPDFDFHINAEVFDFSRALERCDEDKEISFLSEWLWLGQTGEEQRERRLGSSKLITVGKKKKERNSLLFNAHSISSGSFFLVILLEMASEDTPPDFVNRMEKVPAPYLSEQYGYSKDGRLNITRDSSKDNKLTDIGRTILRNDCLDAGP